MEIKIYELVKNILTNENQENNNLFDLMQNDALSAIALHSFTLGFHFVAKNKEREPNFPKFEYMFYVLPIVYNYSSLLVFQTSQEIYTALNKTPSIKLGLQERASKMALQTCDGLNIAFSKKFLTINKDAGTIELLKPYSSKKLTLYMSSLLLYDSVKQIQDCAHKLGHIFAKRNEKNIQQDLNIVF